MKRILVGLVFAFGAMRGGAGQMVGTDPQTLPVSKEASQVSLKGYDKVTFEFEKVELTPPRWSIEVGNDGVGRYYEKVGSAAVEAPASGEAGLHVSAGTMALLKAGAERGGAACETKAKHIAQTGKRVLTYWKGDVPWACTFNYSDNAGVMKTGDAFQAIAETMQYGERLQHEHRFDRLALDAEVDSLEAAMKQGTAIEVQNIAPALKSVLDDERVMERVRRKVARILLASGAVVNPMIDSPGR
jgi:hypothetical protein